MLEDLEGIADVVRDCNSERDTISPVRAEYINECVEGKDPLTLVDRIDELSDCQPPKGVDSNPHVADLIEPIRDSIDTKYLEAPTDIEQIQQIGDYLSETPGLEYSTWRRMGYEERCEVLCDAEMKIAEIEHRPWCEVKFEDLDERKFGHFDPEDKSITLNANYVMADSPEAFKETLDTLVHEGRHAYQDYNMNEREVHCDAYDVEQWKWNYYELGYQRAELCGYEAYANQPVEMDARSFAEDVLNDYFEKVA